jgi:hypothetical protein
MPNRNFDLLLNAARLLRPLLPEIVFVGGSTTTLLITDKAAADVRPTYDVDVIAEIGSYPEYVLFSERLRELGFAEDVSEGAPICRWRQQQAILDVMPLDERILGFSNRWYKAAAEAAEERELDPGLSVRVVSPVFFCATKLEAFAGRGRGDYQASHDLEDLIAVIDGRPELVSEIEASPADVRTHIAAAMQQLRETPAFMDAIPGYLLPDAASQARITKLVNRLEQIAMLRSDG